MYCSAQSETRHMIEMSYLEAPHDLSLRKKSP